MPYQDKTLKCRDCGRDFVFSAREQEFFAEKGFTNEPGRCPDCRSARRSREGGGFGGGARRGGGERQMYPAVCSQCGKQTEVPFQPRADRPVYCPECYAAQRGSSGGTGGGFSRGGGSDRGRRW